MGHLHAKDLEALVILAANMIIRDELDRYLLDSVEVLLGFCDLVCVLDDGSDDGTYEAMRDLEAGGRLRYLQHESTEFYEHEGRARQQSLDWTLSFSPTHIIAVDADEIIEDGAELRRQVEKQPNRPAWQLCMEEVWGCDEDEIRVRCDGKWGPNRSTILYRADGPTPLRIRNQALACGRIPEIVGRWPKLDTGVSILHFGWANAGDRAARHARYVEHDGGRFHDKAHLDSIIDEPAVKLRTASWDKVPKRVKRSVAARANRGRQNPQES